MFGGIGMEQKNLIRNWKYYGPESELGEISATDIPCGNHGYLAGILTLYAWLPLPPGHICNVGSFPFTAKMEMVDGANQKRMHSSDDTLLPALISTAQRLEREGCRFLASTCGYFGHFQKEVAASVDIPCYLSSVIQVPWVRAGLRDDQRIGIICGDAPNLTYHLFESCGVSRADYERCYIYGAQDKPVFSTFTELPGHYDFSEVRGEIVSIAKQMVHDHPDIGAILLECTDLPPFAADISAAVNLPVYDVMSMLNFAAGAVARKPYYGFV